MRAHEASELHRQGKMFGVLVVRTADGQAAYLRAFSAMLDGQTVQDGFVPPVYTGASMPVGHTREQSQRLQRLFFAEQQLVNRAGERRSLLDIFQDTKPIVSPEEWFATGQPSAFSRQRSPLPPSGAGECCAPKLLQYALLHGLSPLALAEFWIGAPPRNELRREGVFYPPCSGRCRPILRWMMGEEEVSAPRTEWQIPVLYEDEWLMVVNKPAGLLSVPGNSGEPYVAQCLHQHVQPVHRLDRDTSGLLVLAKRAEVYKELQAFFQRRDILKRYEAVVRGEGVKVERVKDEGVIDLPLLPNPYDRPRQMVDPVHGKPALTEYRIMEHRADGSVRIDFYPRTGRTHQLRVHAAHPHGLNMPIVGDALYGIAADRLYLHAAEIRFVHPVTKEEMHFCIPSDF